MTSTRRDEIATRRLRLCLKTQEKVRSGDRQFVCSHLSCKSYLSEPCLVCGQSTHTFARWKKGNDSQWTIQLVCPVSRFQSWEDIFQEGDERRRYHFDAEKFLSLYGYCKDDVLEAFQVYEENGYGRIMHQQYPALHFSTRMALIAICDNAHLLHQFKRDTRLMNQGQDQVDEEDDHDG